MTNKKKTIINVIIIVSILVVSLVFLLVFKSNRKVGTDVVVRVNGEEVAKYSLSVDGVYELNGGTNILEIKNGAARMIEANCRDHVCMNRGKIKYTNESITCLPNKITVTVIGGNGDIDIESGVH